MSESKMSDEELVNKYGDSCIDSVSYEESESSHPLHVSNYLSLKAELLSQLKRGREFESRYKAARELLDKAINGEREAEKLVEKTISVLQDAKETIEYVKLYVEKRGLSAEDDCNNSLKLIDDLLTEYAKVKK